MDIKVLLKQLIAIRYVPGKPLGTYSFNVLIHTVIYCIMVIIFAVITTLLAFGYVPVDGGGINNPPATIQYVWQHGLAIVSIPLAVISFLINFVVTIKSKQPKMLIVLACWSVILITINILLSYIDVVALVTPWVTF